MIFFNKKNEDCRDGLKAQFLANLVWLIKSGGYYPTKNITIEYDPKNELYTMTFRNKSHVFRAINHIEVTEQIIKIIAGEITEEDSIMI